MRKVICIIIFNFICSMFAYSQSDLQFAVRKLDRVIQLFIEARDNRYIPGRSTEVSELYFAIDSNGMVKEFYPIGGCTDSLYNIVKQMNPGDFEEWSCLPCKGKFVVVTYFYVSSEPSSAGHAASLWNYFAKAPNEKLIIEATDRIIVRYLQFAMPSAPKR